LKAKQLIGHHPLLDHQNYQDPNQLTWSLSEHPEYKLFQQTFASMPVF